LGQPWLSNFHNWIVGPSSRLHIEYVRDTLYCMISHLKESIKIWQRCMSMCPTNTLGPFFKYPWTQDLKSRISCIN
jgi:hypothetical protein